MSDDDPELDALEWAGFTLEFAWWLLFDLFDGME